MEYEALVRADDEIRLLTILPPGSDASSPVTCQLDHFSLNTVSDPPEEEGEFRFPWGDYVALSYVWGSPDPPREIILNGHIVRVTPNLEAALRHLRESPEAASGLKFWIDALCINQEDISERSAEVKRMKQIYKTAQHVVAWVGLEFEGVEAALGLMEELARQVDGGQWRHPTSFLSPWRRYEHVFRGAVRPLQTFLERPYWQRLWIIQELALGEQVWILCGSRRVRLDIVAKAGQFISDTFTNLKRTLKKELDEDEDSVNEISELIWRINQLGSIRRSASEQEKASTNMKHLDAIVRLGQHASVTDPRDKVYGLLGLLGGEIEAAVTPDYTAPTQQVYADFVRGFVAAFENLNVILLKSDGDDRPAGWPSWVPDFERPSKSDGAVLYTPYRAGGENVLEVRFSEDGRLLQCYGIRIKIGARPVIDPSAKPPTPPPAARRPKRAGRRLANEDDMVSRFWSMIGRPPTTGNPSSSSLLQDPGSGLPNLPGTGVPGSLEWALFGTGAKEIGSLSPSNPNSEDIITRSMQALEEVSLALRSVNEHTVAGFTESGHFVWASSPLQQTDIVCVLLGCGYPVVLRPCDDGCFRIVSECCIHEIMSGQALESLGEDGVELELFSLC